MQGATGGATSSPTWEFFVPVGPTSGPSTSWINSIDVNGDGYCDAAVGSAKGVALYLGSASGLPATPSMNLPANLVGGETAGDVDGDGYGDLMVADIQGNAEGVLLGGAAGPTGTPQLFDWRQYGGYPVQVTAGDVNADGYADLVGTYGSNQVSVFYGGRGGLSQDRVSFITPPGSALNGYYMVYAGGDLNGDGYGDTLVEPTTAQLLVYLGSADGLPSQPQITWAGPFGTEQFAYLDAASPADVNGDGYSDVIFSAAPHPGGQATDAGLLQHYSNQEFVFLGSSSPPTAPSQIIDPPNPSTPSNWGLNRRAEGDVNADGFDDVAVDGPQFWKQNPPQTEIDLYAGSSQGLNTAPMSQLLNDSGGVWPSLGDVNGDGFDDMAIAEPTELHIYYGGPSGIAQSPDLILPFP
jgi:hypothetical protein